MAQNTGRAILLIGHLNKAAAELGISARTVRQAKQRLGKKLHSERSSTQWILSLKTKRKGLMMLPGCRFATCKYLVQQKDTAAQELQAEVAG